jgi:lysophospholipase L1-like esterase
MLAHFPRMIACGRTTAALGALAIFIGFGLPLLASSLLAEEPPKNFKENVQLRGNLEGCFRKFASTRQGRVAFLGGSITEMEGYRPMVCRILTERFPQTKFDFINAGISSTCSTTGAFRLERDVLSQGPIDLLLVEFAVNDDQDAHHPRAACIRGMEGIVRQARQRYPELELVVTYFLNESMLQTIQDGKVPLSIEAHEAVMKHYGVSSIHLASEVARQITAGELSWKQYGGTHPAPFGNAIAAAMIADLLHRAGVGLNAKAVALGTQPLPPPIDPQNYARGIMIDPQSATSLRGWKLGVPDWEQLPGSKRPRYTNLPILSADEAGAEAAFDFEGTAIGAFLLAGPDAGLVEASIDGGPFTTFDLYHHYSEKLHYPRSVMFATDLAPGKHRLKLRIAEKTNSHGHAMRIVQFLVNRSPVTP